MRTIDSRFDVERDGVGTAEIRCDYCGAMTWSSRVFRDANGLIQCDLHEGEVTRTEIDEIIAAYDPPEESVDNGLGGSVEDASTPGVHLTTYSEVINGG